jgi:hypothetical protein
MQDTSATMATYEEPRASSIKRVLLSYIHEVAETLCDMQ